MESAVYVQGPLKSQLTAPWLRGPLRWFPWQPEAGKTEPVRWKMSVRVDLGREESRGREAGGRREGAGGELAGTSGSPLSAPGWRSGPGKLWAGRPVPGMRGLPSEQGPWAVGSRGEEAAKQG